MKSSYNTKDISIPGKTKAIFCVILTLLVLSSIIVIYLTWISNKERVENDAIATTQIIASALNGVALVETIENIDNPDDLYYLSLKNRLVTEVSLDSGVSHVFIWTLKNNELVSVVDSSSRTDANYLIPGTPFSGLENQSIEEYNSGELFTNFPSSNNEELIILSSPIRDISNDEVIAYFSLVLYADGFYADAFDEVVDNILLAVVVISAYIVYYIFYISKLKLKKVKNQIRNNFERFESLAKQSKTLTWEINCNKVITFVSSNVFDILGYKTDELVDKKLFSEFFPSQEIEKINNIVTELLDSRVPFAKVVFSLLSKNNNLVYVSTTAIPILDEKNKVLGYKGSCVDVTEIEKASKLLKYEKDLSDKYLNLAGVMLLVINKHGNITLINKKGCEILGLDEHGLIGLNWFDNFIPLKSRFRIKKVFSEIINQSLNPPTKYENTIITAQGEELSIAWENSLLYDVNNKVIGVLSSGDDITERKRYRNKLIQMSYKDALTGLYNRRYYKENLSKYNVIEKLPLTIIMSDINGLKLINDAFGHDSGDKLLISAAELFAKHCRKRDLLARIGGDEFVILMPYTSEYEAESIISAIKDDAKLIYTQSIELSISFGFKTKIQISESITDTFKSAEDSMYQQKLLESSSMRSGTIDTILNALYEKDKNSERHCRAVADISERLAVAVGMNTLDVGEVKKAALLHDIGKIVISSSIINKIGKLTADEYNSIKSHSEVGFRILNSMQDLRRTAHIVLSHHERWDGKGYPRGIKGSSIPLKARIISIADAYDAMTNERTYRKTFTKQEALKEILKHSGTQFDPKLVKTFKTSFTDIVL